MTRRLAWIVCGLAPAFLGLAACGSGDASPPPRSPLAHVLLADSVPVALPSPTPAHASPASSPAPAPTPLASAVPEAPPTDAPPVKCVRDASFPSPWAVPEASGAALVELRRGKPEILVVSDSGNGGAALAWSAQGGTRALTLPLDATASDDIEGVAWLAQPSGGRLYTLTSSGAVRRFSPDGSGGLRRDEDAYPIGAPPLACPDLGSINCGKNYEGLCLRPNGAPAPPGIACAGYAASKAETSLYCVVRDARGRLSIDPSRPPTHLPLAHFLGHTDVLSDCAFGAEGGPAAGDLIVTTNIFGGSTTYLVDEATGHVRAFDSGATLTNEAVAVDRDGAFYAFQDDNGKTSVAARFTCSGWADAVARP